MTINGCDYSFSRPNPGRLRLAGKQFAVRYLSRIHQDGKPSGKDLSRFEYVVLRAAGINVPIVWECEAGAAKGGFDRGVADAHAYLERAGQVGLDLSRPAYFAVDFQVLGSEIDVVLAYFRGVASVLGAHRTGVYGQFSVVKAVLDAGLAEWGWQTYAWSRDANHVVQWDPRAQLRQVLNGQKLAGGVVDLCVATVVDYGQHPMPATSRPKPAPAPGGGGTAVVPPPVHHPAPHPTPHPVAHPVVNVRVLHTGVRDEQVRTYQRYLRPFAARLGLNLARLNPSGATGFYGKETAATTRAVYQELAKHGGPAWLRGDLTIPGKVLLEKIGLQVKG